MAREPLENRFGLKRFMSEAGGLLQAIRGLGSVEDARERLFMRVSGSQFESLRDREAVSDFTLTVVRDCARAFRGMLNARSDERAGFSLIGALWDLARGAQRPDLGPGFFAEMIHIAAGLEGRARLTTRYDFRADSALEGRPAAIQRSEDLDRLWARVEEVMNRYEDGLSRPAADRRAARRAQVMSALSASESDFDDWEWQAAHIATDEVSLGRMVRLSGEEAAAVRAARRHNLPFGVTPYYAALMDDDSGTGRDRALRAQVIPTMDYVLSMAESRDVRTCAFDFMLESDTSPTDLVTRRYPSVAILKPINTCPQICVYCQRNFEIEDAMAPGAVAGEADLERAFEFITHRPALREILVTGGDPLALPDAKILKILRRLADIPHVDLIRIGTRTPVSMPMRITEGFAEALGGLREPGRREICVVTHVEHPYEVTRELAQAVDLLRRRGIGVYNQMVYTFFVSRRFEAARLRMLLRRVGIDPYYTFMPKGKDETGSFRVPLARLAQEQKEEARLLSGLQRTDEAVYNVPGLGKNYLRAVQHRDLLTILPDGSRVYDFHPWEKGISEREPYVGKDVPILSYLSRLEEIGEDPDDYSSIWYYY